MASPALQQRDAFFDYLRYERRASPQTLKAYQRDLQRLFEYGIAQRREPWQDIDDLLARNWLASLHQAGMASSSIQRMLSSCRTFYRWLVREDKHSHNPFDAIKAPRGPRKLPATLDIDAMQQLLALPGNDPLTVRDRAILELFYSSGFRLAELVGLDLPDVDLASGEARVSGKGGKVRVVPVGRYAIQSLRAWLSVRAELADSDETAMFVSRRGTRLAARSIEQRLKHWATRQGINRNLHPHMLRHSFASHMLESSGDLRAVQELLGHQNISTTQIYTHLDFQHLAKIYDRAHPRARKK